MLRYFYILCLLLGIECGLCFDYISDHSFKRRYDIRPNTNYQRNKIRQAYNRLEIQKPRIEYDTVDEKDSVAQIDVASFIQKPDEYAVDNSLQYETNNEKSKMKSNNYYIYEPMDGTNTEGYVTRNNKRQFHINSGVETPPELNANARLFKDTLDPRQPNLNSLSLRELNNVKMTKSREHRRQKYDDHFRSSYNVHRNERKCLEHLKFPFFSHKNESAKTKKEKKRKIFCFNCSKKEKSTEESTISSNTHLENRGSLDLNKRSNEILKPTTSMDYNCYKHNSRQFPSFDLNHNMIQTSGKSENLEDFSKLIVDKTEEDNNAINISRREKRDDFPNDKTRQMKELDELQKKIDRLDIAATANQFTVTQQGS